MKIIKYIILLICLISCVKQPSAPEPVDIPDAPKAALILCEGLWRMDNSSLSLYDIETGEAIRDYFPLVNPNLKLGDLANDLVIRGDTAYIVLTTAGVLERINAKTGVSIDRTFMPGNQLPRKLRIVNDTTAFVSSLNTHSIIKFNPQTMEILNSNIPVGPAPEGIASYANLVFVANSGYGDYLAHLPKAGTISVINVHTSQEVRTLVAGPNVTDVLVSEKHKKLYAIYRHLPSKPDSLGGVIVYDLNTFEEIEHIRINAYIATLTPTQDSLLFISDDGVHAINTSISNSSSKLFIENPNTKDFWYAITVANDNSIWIGNARNYQVDGEVLVYSQNEPRQLIKRFNVGLNPNTIRFR